MLLTVPPVALSQQPTLGYSFLEVPHVLLEKYGKGQHALPVSRPQRLPLVGASRSYGEDLTDTLALQLLQNGGMLRTIPVLIPLDWI